MKVKVQNLTGGYIHELTSILEREVDILHNNFHSMNGEQHLFYETLDKILSSIERKVKAGDPETKRYSISLTKGQAYVLCLYFSDDRYGALLFPALAHVVQNLNQKIS